MSAVLAIWNDCKPGREAVYEAWYREEHLIERMGVYGFEVGRRYVAVDAVQTYLTTYEVEALQVLRSAEYLARIDNPTPRTRDIMRDGFMNMSRTVCRRTRVNGPIRGVFVVTLAWTANVDHAPIIEAIQKRGEALHTELWVSAERPTADATTTEEALRGHDTKIDTCLLAEFPDETSGRGEAALLRQAAPEATVGLYHKICELREGDL